ncbi:unnamed protein product [Durusdinium trenchii]|uniref:Uncharacterized protein n=1 Tax=Durusdinium trenchii TaxID=1381693 RepID=A0ABP0HW29_9DINO
MIHLPCRLYLHSRSLAAEFRSMAPRFAYGGDETWMDETPGHISRDSVTGGWHDRPREDQLMIAQARLWETSKRAGKLKASLEAVANASSWLQSKVEELCPSLPLPERHPAMSRLERQHRVKVLQDYLHHQPHQCRVLRFQVAQAVKSAVEAEKTLYEAAYRSGLAANAAMQAALNPALAFPPYQGEPFLASADHVSRGLCSLCLAPHDSHGILQSSSSRRSAVFALRKVQRTWRQVSRRKAYLFAT